MLTWLTLQGTYEPPLGVLGRTLDRMLLRRLAEAPVKRFADDLAERIETLLEEGGSVTATRSHRSGQR